MSKLLLGLFVASFAASARANPMLDKCLPFAPQVCGLTEKSTPDEFISCFETVKLDVKKAGPAACAEELAHARVHKACGKTDIPTLCAGVTPGGNRTMSCLKKKFSKLTKPCHDAYGEYMLLENGGKKKGRGHSGVSAVRC